MYMDVSHNIKDLFQGTATVGERGQVVIPIQARETCGIDPGDKLLAFIHPAGAGVLFLKLEAMLQVSSLLAQLVEDVEETVASSEEERA